MVWSEIDASQVHVSLALISVSLLVTLTLALYLKNRFEFSEVIVAILYGIIVGPASLNWFRATTWASNEAVLTLELARIVMNIQIFTAAQELPSKWIKHNWFSLLQMLIPVMVCGYLLNSVFVWGLLPGVRWVEALIVAGCITATDPVLASAVLSGDFSRRLPARIVHLLSAESASNDGMALPFMMLPVTILLHEHHAPSIAKDFICVTILYQVIFSCVVGVIVGWLASVLLRFLSHHTPYREEYLIIYTVTFGLLCAGIGSILGLDDFLISFFAGTLFSWDGWIHKNNNSLDVTNFLDLLLNTCFFVYFGAIMPWSEFNSIFPVWRFVVIAVLVLVGRRIPILFALYKVIPDIKTWKEALICGHFGPIGVAAIYMSLDALAQLDKHQGSQASLGTNFPQLGYRVVWALTCFIVLASIIVHGSSIFVLKLVPHAL